MSTTAFERALRGYDGDFQRRLADVLFRALVEASTIETTPGAPPVVCLRTGESIDATVDVLITMMSTVAAYDNPATLRKHCEAFAKKVRREVGRARAEGIADILGGAKAGHA